MLGIDLFAGAGGMSLGAKSAGVNVIAAVENNISAAETYSYNFQKEKVFCKDISLVKATDFEIKNKAERPLIVFGGPPCQGFSTSNQKTRNAENITNWLFKEYLRLVSELLPDWVVFENVRGMLQTESGVFVKSTIGDLEGLGYFVQWKVLNSVDFGIPQDRSRLFVIGRLNRKLNFSFPENTSTKKVTVKDAIHDLPLLNNGNNDYKLPYKTKPESDYARRLRGKLTHSTNHIVTRNANYVIERYCHIPQGGNWKDVPDELMSNYKDKTRCHSGIYHRLYESEPSIVIGNYRKNMLIHPNQDRGLSVREAARLQSFPDWFEFKGMIGCQQQQVGNAVPPMLAEVVFNAIKKSIEQK
jgi:DNA (cytosine-5)-methyltransferase 1